MNLPWHFQRSRHPSSIYDLFDNDVLSVLSIYSLISLLLHALRGRQLSLACIRGNVPASLEHEAAWYGPLAIG